MVAGAKKLSACRAMTRELSDLYVQASAEHPDLAVPRDVFFTHLGRVPEVALDRVRGADLYLAIACARGDARAHAKLDAEVMPKLGAALERFEPAVDADDLQQKLRTRLLLPRGARPPRIDSYVGLGSLANWLRAIAVRLALRMTRRRRAEAANEEHLEQLVADDDPELGLLRAQYRDAFRAAFRAAFESLSTRDRNVLRLHLLDGLSVDRIAALYGVHRASAFRWLEQVRGRLDLATRRCLAGDGRLCLSEIDQVLHAMQSQLAVSFRTLLAPTAASGRAHALPR